MVCLTDDLYDFRWHLHYGLITCVCDLLNLKLEFFHSMYQLISYELLCLESI